MTAFADRPALLLSPTEQVSHRDLDGLVDRAARTLSSSTPGLVAVYGDRDLATVVAYLGCAAAGHICALYDARTPQAARRNQLAAYRPEFVVYGPSVRVPGAVTIEGYRRGGELPGGAVVLCRSGPPGPAVSPENALLMSTSGSTGSPQVVRLSRANVDANAEAIAQALDLAPDDRAITSLPLHYCYGLSVLNSHLSVGASVALSGSGAPSLALWRTIGALGCTSLAGVPSTFEAMARGSLGLEQIPGVRVLTQAGGRLRDDLVTRYHELMSRRGGRFVVMYGQTEATARITVLRHEEGAGRSGSVGRPVPGVSIRIEDDAGGPLDDGQVGEVVVRGPGVMLGYATCREDLAYGDRTGGCLRTGDLGRLDHGYLWLAGRRSRMAKVVGRRINLDEVEAVCRETGPSRVVGTADEHVVIVVEGDRERFVPVRHRLARTLSIPAAALRIVPVARLPHTTTGKPDYAVLQSIAEGDGRD